MKTKKCKVCGLEKSLDEFYRHPGSRDGYRCQCKSCRNEKVKEWKSNHLGCEIEYSRRYWGKYPEKKLAHSILNHGVRDGKIKKGVECEICGSTQFLEGHHEDYNKPLDVRWLCIRCHNKLHGKKLQKTLSRVQSGCGVS